PLVFAPFLKHVIWGGTKICEYKGIESPASDIGESWEISVLPGQESVVEKGEYEGYTLSRLAERFGELLLGKKINEKYGGKFPLLIKFIDAHDRLSVQVHPDDELARQRHNSLGKSELWYIVAAAPCAKIYVGLKKEVSPNEFMRHVEQGSLEEVLAEWDSVPGDVFFLPAGRIHAIGAGNLLVEIQESSDVTYRIYDYDRRDSHGNPRPLHTAEARDAIDYTVQKDYKGEPVTDLTKEKELVSCEHFTTRYYRITSPRPLPCSPDSFTVVICISGEITVSCRDGEETIRAGHTLLIPAIASLARISGNGSVLVTQG
ncbi:MAG: class I mannose-6-phosphate isomerase, partial [Muribaculaceae bacterium]|nr:class I mannose-6-phosphate isomerase [Muribaculaceae bacterium]